LRRAVYSSLTVFLVAISFRLSEIVPRMLM
jgi:hypothetical protein